MRIVSNCSRTVLFRAIPKLPELHKRVLTGALVLAGMTLALHTKAQTTPRVMQKVAPSLLCCDAPQEVLVLFPAAVAIPDGPLTKVEKGQTVYNHLRAQADNHQKEVRTFLRDRGIPYRSFLIANAVHATLSRDEIEYVASMESVRKIIPNDIFRVSQPIPVKDILRSAGPEWGIQKIRADSVWALGFRGQGVVVAGGDTGFEWDHPALVQKYRGWDSLEADHNYNWHDAIHEISPLHEDSIVVPENNPCGLDVTEPCDDHGHGTHTMGIMIGSDSNNLIGVAPDARWIACRNMERGYGSPATYLECFEWYLAPTDINGDNPDPAKAPHVINNSWSCPEMEGCNPDNFEILREAVVNLRNAGIFVTVSAGNSGSACSSISTPAAIFDESFTVGATNIADTIAGFSARGPVMVDSSGRLKPDVVAPGVQVRSSWLDSTYRTTNGTSMAAPHVAGTVALMISANPALAGEVEVLEDILRSTAVPLTTTQECGGLDGEDQPNNTYGFGRIDALAAVEQALLYSRVEEIADPRSLAIYPNPTAGEFKVDLRGLDGKGVLRIYTVEGVQVLQRKVQALLEPVRLYDVPGGVYIVTVHNGTVLHTGRIVKF